jgi:hypothetical protein
METGSFPPLPLSLAHGSKRPSPALLSLPPPLARTSRPTTTSGPATKSARPFSPLRVTDRWTPRVSRLLPPDTVVYLRHERRNTASSSLRPRRPPQHREFSRPRPKPPPLGTSTLHTLRTAPTHPHAPRRHAATARHGEASSFVSTRADELPPQWTTPARL